MKSVANKPRFRPEVFGKYTLIAPIATGGMGELFLARMHAESGFNRLVVIKRILPHLTDKSEFVDMFQDEARVAAQIHHPNVCQILEFGQIEGRYYMALEYLEGISMTQVIVAGRKYDKLRALRFLVAIMTQVCEGLHFAHNLRTPTGALAGVVHRDVNPKNIFVTSAGVAKVIDFGIVKALGAVNVTRTGSVKGTYSYMSPEQIKATAVDRRSDVFSLGTVTWEALTGVRLFKRDNDFHTWRAITEDPIPPPSQFRKDLPPELDVVLAKALERDKEKRFATTHALALALEKAITNAGGPLTTVAIASRLEHAFETEIEEQRQRSYTPSTIEDDDGDGSKDTLEPGFEHRVTAEEAVATVTPSAHRLSPEMFARAPSADGAPPSTIDEPVAQTPSTPRPSAGPTAPTLLGESAAALLPVSLSPLNTPTNTPSGAGAHTGTNAGANTGANLGANLGASLTDKPPKKRLGVVLALLMIAGMFSVAAAIYVTRGGNENEESKGKAALENEATEKATTEKATKTSNETDPTPPPTDTEATEVIPTGVVNDELDTDNQGTDPQGADLEREMREKEAAAKAAEEKKLADEKREKREKEKREKEKREEEEREKEKREKEKRDKEKREQELRDAALPPGSISVSSVPWGMVTINGKKVGQTPVIGRSLKVGTHRIRIDSAAGSFSTTVRIQSGKSKRIRHKF